MYHDSRASGDPFAAPGTETLQTVLDRLQEDRDLDKTRRAELRSAVRTFCKVAGHEPYNVVAGPIRIRNLMSQCFPARHGISEARWNNVRSLLSKAMERTGISVAAGKMLAPMNDAWKALYDRLPNKGAKCNQSRLLRHLSVHGVQPDTVTLSDIELFEADNEKSVLKDPVKANQKMRRGWNEARRTVPGWPDLELEIPDLRDAYTVPFEALPATYKKDVDAFLDWSARSDDFSDDAPIRPVRPATVKNKLQAIHFITSAAIRRGVPMDRFRTLRDLIDPEVVRDGLRFLVDRYGKDRSGSLQNMMAQIVIVARDWVKVSDEDLKPLRKLLQRVTPSHRNSMTQKNRDVISAFEDRTLILRLVRLPDRLFDLACREPEHSKHRGFKQSAAVMIAILLTAPIRVRNLASIRIGHNLIRVTKKRIRRYELYFPPEEVKNDVDQSMLLPDWVGIMIDSFVADGRQILLDSPSDWLFPGLTDGHVATATITSRLAELSTRHLGVRMTAHQFRHLAGALYLMENPGQHEAVRRLLGHTNLNTTVNFYAGMQQPEASRHYAATIEGHRQEAGVAGNKSKRRNR